jgi:hypothetical protein
VLKALRAHTAKITQNWLKVNMENHWSQEIWPPSSPDCTPVDLSMWSEFEREVNKHPHYTLASLRVKILEGMGIGQQGQGGRHPFLQEVLVSD